MVLFIAPLLSKLANLDNLMKVDMGLAADVGTLQRLPKVGQSEQFLGKS